MSRLRHYITFLLVLAALGTDSVAQPASCDLEREEYQEAFLDANRIRAKILNTGTLFWNDGQSVYSVGQANALFNASLVVGGLVDGELRVAGSTYGPYEFWPGPVDSVLAGVDCRRFNRMYKVTRNDLNRLEEGQPPTDDLRDWPWRLGAPVVDGDGNPDNYDLAAGDRPEMLGTEMIYWIMNDVAGLHEKTETEPLGLEVHATAFAAPSNDPAIHYATFYRYRLINRSEARIDSAFVGMFVDPDLGAAYDDYVGSDSLTSLAFVYNADNDDDGNFGLNPPAVGFRMFDGPEASPDDYDNDYDGTVDEPGERLGMSYFAYYNGGAGSIGSPQTGAGFYNFLKGHWADGLPITEGENGRASSSKPVRYTYPADPPEYWSELNSDGSGTPIDPADRKFVQSMGPFRLEPGEETELFFGILYARGSDHIDSVFELKKVAAELDGLRPEDVAAETVQLRGGPVRTVTPGDGAQNIPLDARFIWSGVVRDARYELELTNLDSGEKRSIEYEWLDDVEVRLELEPSTNYSWRVREFTVDVNGPWTPLRTFSTGAVPFSEFSPFSDFIVTQNAGGELDPPIGASPDWAGFPGFRPTDEQQVGPGQWVVHTRVDALGEQGYPEFVDRVMPRNPYRTLLSDYEIRFTGTSRGLNAAGDVLEESLPFEIWDVGKNAPYNGAGGVRLIPVVGDAEGDGWGLRLVDHVGSSGDNDPHTDWITFHDPADRSSDEAGYLAFAEAADAGEEVSAFVGPEVLSEIVLVGWNLGLEPGEIHQMLPEQGTIFRIVTGEVPPPVLTAPGPGQFVPTDPVTFHWMDTPADRPSLELSRSSDFTELVTIIDDVEPGLTLDPLPEGMYYWRVRGATGLSPTWSFTVAAGVDTEEEPGAPEQFNLGRPYPNPARESVTLPVQGRATGAVTIELYDVLGRRVTTSEATGSGPIRLDVSGLAAGVYVLRAAAEGRNWSRTIIIRR